MYSRFQMNQWCSHETFAAAAGMNIQRSLSALNFGRFDAEFGCYSPSDVAEAHLRYEANCGPASFAAMRRTRVIDVMQAFPHFPKKPWTTVGHMRQAMKLSAVDYWETPDLPEYGVALLQLKVDGRPLHGLFSLRQTHWVAVFRGSFYDVNWDGWLPIRLWEQLVLPLIWFGNKPVRSWSVRRAFSVRCPVAVEAALISSQKEGAIRFQSAV